ncbi:MAG: hypothetical protein WAU69_06420, partial [Solirubrobacteraceae bacterium]
SCEGVLVPLTGEICKFQSNVVHGVTATEVDANGLDPMRLRSLNLPALSPIPGDFLKVSEVTGVRPLHQHRINFAHIDEMPKRRCEGRLA